MFKFLKEYRLFLQWRDTPYKEFAEIHELNMLAARRCAHDLGHASGEIRDPEMSKFFWDRHYQWRDVFYPVENQKRYRHQLHDKIAMLEDCQEKLCEILKKHNVDILEYERWSPGGGIPF